MEAGDLFTYGAAFVIGNFSGGVIVNELLKHKLERRRTRDERRDVDQINQLRSLQYAMEEINRGRVVYVATKLGVTEVTGRWPSALPTPEEDAMWFHGESGLRVLLPTIRDDKVRALVTAFETAARDAFQAKSFEEASPRVTSAREALEAANARIGEVIRSL